MSVSLDKGDRTTNATLAWSWGKTERVNVLTRAGIVGGRMYVQRYPESVRTMYLPELMRYGTVERMTGWEEISRLTLD